MRISDIIEGVNEYLEEIHIKGFLLHRELLTPHKTIKAFKTLTVEVYLHTPDGNSKLGEINVSKKVVDGNTEEIYKEAGKALIGWLIKNKDLYVTWY